MSSPEHLVSIGLPVRNGASHLSETLKMLTGQKYENIEIIISDNASTDQTEEICRDFAAHDSRVTYLRQSTNIGSVNNFEFVVKETKGEYFFWASDHDWWHEDFVKELALLLDSDMTINLAFSGAEWLEEDGSYTPIIQPPLETRPLRGFQIARFHQVLWGLDNCYPAYGLFRKSALEMVMPIPHLFGPDLVLLFELAMLGTFACVPRILFRLRRLKDSLSATVQTEKLGIEKELGSAEDAHKKFVSTLTRRICSRTKKPVDKLLAIASIRAAFYGSRYRWFKETIRMIDLT